MKSLFTQPELESALHLYTKAGFRPILGGITPMLKGTHIRDDYRADIIVNVPNSVVRKSIASVLDTYSQQVADMFAARKYQITDERLKNEISGGYWKWSKFTLTHDDSPGIQTLVRLFPTSDIYQHIKDGSVTAGGSHHLYSARELGEVDHRFK